MRGSDVYRHAVHRLTEVTRSVCEAHGLTPDDLDLFVYHQANARILAAVGDRLGLPAHKIVNCVERHGNTSAASIPLALSEAVKEGRLRSGSLALLAAFGAGFTWAGTLVEWQCV